MAFEGQLAQSEVGAGMIWFLLQDAPELFPGLSLKPHFREQFAQVQQGLHVPRITPELGQIVATGRPQVPQRPVRLSDAGVGLRVVGIQLQSLLPAGDGPTKFTAVVEAVGDVVQAQGALGLDLTGEVEHRLGLVVVAHLRVGDDAIAVARLVRRVDLLNAFEVLQGLPVTPQARVIHPQAVEYLHVVGLEFQRPLIGFGGLVEGPHGVQSQGEVEVPGGVVGIDVDGAPEFLGGRDVLARLVQLPRFLNAPLRLGPIVHRQRPSPPT